MFNDETGRFAVSLHVRSWDNSLSYFYWENFYIFKNEKEQNKSVVTSIFTGFAVFEEFYSRISLNLEFFTKFTLSCGINFTKFNGRFFLFELTGCFGIFWS